MLRSDGGCAVSKAPLFWGLSAVNSIGALESHDNMKLSHASCYLEPSILVSRLIHLPLVTSYTGSRARTNELLHQLRLRKRLGNGGEGQIIGATLTDLLLLRCP